MSCYSVSQLLCYVEWDRWINTLCMRECHYSFISCLSARPAKPPANTKKKQDSINGWQTGWLMKTKHYFTQPHNSPYTAALGVLWFGPLRYREHAKANLVLACHKLSVQGGSQGEVDSAVSSILMDPFFCRFCKVSHQRLQIPPTISLKLCSMVVKQCHFGNENEDPGTSNLSGYGRQSYHVYWASVIHFPLSPTSPWVISLGNRGGPHVQLDLWSPWNHPIQLIIHTQSYPQAFENVCPSPKVVKRTPQCWKVHKLPGLFSHKMGLLSYSQWLY